MAEEVEWQVRVTRPRCLDGLRQVGDIIVDMLDIEALALRAPAAAQVERGDGKAPGRELLCGALILSAVGVDAVANDQRCAGLALGRPKASAP